MEHLLDRYLASECREEYELAKHNHNMWYGCDFDDYVDSGCDCSSCENKCAQYMQDVAETRANWQVDVMMGN